MVLDLEYIKETLSFMTYHQQVEFVNSFIDFLRKIKQTPLLPDDCRFYNDVFILSGYIIYHLIIIKDYKSYTILLGDEINSYYSHNFYMFNIKNQFEANVVKKIILQYCNENNYKIKIDDNIISVVKQKDE